MAPSLADLQGLATSAAGVVSHPKFKKCGPGPAWFWVVAFAHVQATLMPTFLPESDIDYLGVRDPRRMAAHLISAGLWEPVPGGWHFLELDAVLVTPPAVPDARPAIPARETVSFDPTLIFLTFPTTGVGPKEWPLTNDQIKEWEALFPNIDVRQECRSALAWVKANERKTAGGMRKFLVKWLTRTTNDRRGSQKATTTLARGRTGAAPPGKYDHH